VWQKAMELVTETYNHTKSFPKEERYGLTSQLKRSSVSLPSNMAEGYGRNSTQDYVRFLRIANGSLYELQNMNCKPNWK
jgi:four helix bundle protein